MSNFVLIFICLIIGSLMKKTGRLPMTTAASLNGFIIFVSLPATVLLQIPNLFATTKLSSQMLLPIAMPWLIFLASWALFSKLGKIRGWSQARQGALILTAGLGNTSFVGLPLLEALYGIEAVRWGVLIDQLGSFLVLSTLGLYVASSHGQQRHGEPKSPLKQIVTFPPFIALVVAFVIVLGGISLNEMVTLILGKLSATLVPLALIAVGFQLKLSFSILRRYWRPLTLGLGYKLILCPLLFFIIFHGDSSLMAKVTVLEAAMATMITSAVVASDFGLDEELANLMVGVSIPISLISVPLWNLFI